MNPRFITSMAHCSAEILKQIRNTQDQQTITGLLSLLLTLCRNIEDVAPRNASTSAQHRANQLGLGDLRQYHFDHGSKFPGGRKLSQLHWEHWTPAVHIRNSILSLPQDYSPQQIESLLGHSRICWITLDENSKLNNLGFKSTRPNPHLAYQQANITLAYPWP
jgi:hypothetical protein